jgi:hypothetical protein
MDLASVPPDAATKVNNMKGAIETLVVAALALALPASAAQAQQAGPGSGSGRKHHEQKTDAGSKSPKADEKAYNAALKSLPNKPYDPWLGAR